MAAGLVLLRLAACRPALAGNNRSRRSISIRRPMLGRARQSAGGSVRTQRPPCRRALSLPCPWLAGGVWVFDGGGGVNAPDLRVALWRRQGLWAEAAHPAAPAAPTTTYNSAG